MDVTPLVAMAEVVRLAPPLEAGQSGRRRRRSWTLEQKLAIVQQVCASGDLVAVVARRHDMNAN